jgi:hypothetical protein
MLERFQRTLHGKEDGRELGRRLVKKSPLNYRANCPTLDCRSHELMSVESRPTHREEELPPPD